jgi:hypothetical protein
MCCVPLDSIDLYNFLPSHLDIHSHGWCNDAHNNQCFCSVFLLLESDDLEDTYYHDDTVKLTR